MVLDSIATAEVLFEAGFQVLEVPLNSPRPMDSIARLAAAFPERLIGAGTVTAVADVQPCLDAGCRLVVAPNFDPRVAVTCPVSRTFESAYDFIFFDWDM